MNILLFDGVCNLCNSFVNKLIRLDKQNHLKFATLQSSAGIKLLKEYNIKSHGNDLKTVIYIKENKVYDRSSAAIHALIDTGYFIKIASLLLLIPKAVRDLVYRIISKYRYKWFGKRDTCMIPTAELKERFLN